jgi:hypothetical protein
LLASLVVNKHASNLYQVRVVILSILLIFQTWTLFVVWFSSLANQTESYRKKMETDIEGGGVELEGIAGTVMSS